MPNHVENHIEYSGDARHIRTMLESIKTDEYGIGTVDFNKIIPMPESLNIEAGSKTNRGLKTYKEFIDMYTFGRFAEEAEKALENIPVDSENAFLSQRTDIIKEEWELGKIAWQNIRQYGSPTWYECYVKLCITLIPTGCTVLPDIVPCGFSELPFVTLNICPLTKKGAFALDRDVFKCFLRILCRASEGIYFDKIPISLQPLVGSAARLDMQAFRHRDDLIKIDRTYTVFIVFY